MVPRRGLRIDLIPRELPLVLVGLGGATLAVWVGAEPVAVLPLAFLVSVRVGLHRI
ncbi:hypothetical protein [Streptomyces sp. NPDC057909]|uniref:hypothetical protein n=1 Tax=Streptomyces sp. NPDC057909 TaxID=3346277 RepID=UPI0036EE8E1F